MLGLVLFRPNLLFEFLSLTKPFNFLQICFFSLTLFLDKVANEVRHLLKDYTKTIPTVLEIPSKDSPYVVLTLLLRITLIYANDEQSGAKKKQPSGFCRSFLGPLFLPPPDDFTPFFACWMLQRTRPSPQRPSLFPQLRYDPEQDYIMQRVNQMLGGAT